MKFQIRFEGPGPAYARFKGTEDENGAGIKVGEWVQEDSDWLLKIDTEIDPDYEAAQADRP